MKRINFLIDDELYNKFKKYVKENRDTMTRLIIEFIKKEIRYEK